jgi:hypothetical protein
VDARPGHSALFLVPFLALFLVPFLALPACLTRGSAGDQATAWRGECCGGVERRSSETSPISPRLLFACSAVNVCGRPNGCVLQRRVGYLLALVTDQTLGCSEGSFGPTVVLFEGGGPLRGRRSTGVALLHIQGVVKATVTSALARQVVVDERASQGRWLRGEVYQRRWRLAAVHVIAKAMVAKDNARHTRTAVAVCGVRCRVGGDRWWCCALKAAAADGGAHHNVMAGSGCCRRCTPPQRSVVVHGDALWGQRLFIRSFIVASGVHHCGGDDLAVAVDGGTRRRVGDSHRRGCMLPTAVCIIAKTMAADGERCAARQLALTAVHGDEGGRRRRCKAKAAANDGSARIANAVGNG